MPQRARSSAHLNQTAVAVGSQRKTHGHDRMLRRGKGGRDKKEKAKQYGAHIPSIPLTRTRGNKKALHTPSGMSIKKASGRCYGHQPDGHGVLYALPHVTRFVPFYLRLRPVFAGRRPLL